MKKFFTICLVFFFLTVLSSCEKKIAEQQESTVWKTYTSQAYWYQFQYPWDWNFDHDSLDYNPRYHDVTIRMLSQREDVQININHLFNQNDRTYFVSEKEKEQYVLQIQNEKNSFIQNLKNSKYTKLSINGLQEFYLWKKDPWSWIMAPRLYLVTYVILWHDIFEFAYFVTPLPLDESMWGAEGWNKPTQKNMTDEEHEKLFKQIIATFKSIQS